MALRNAIPAAVLAYIAVRAQTIGPYIDHSHMWGGWGWGGMSLGPVMMLVFIAALIIVVNIVLRAMGVVPGRPAGPATWRPYSSG